MSGKTVKRLYDLEIDEISLVDRPANQHGLVAIAKRAEEDRMPVYDSEGYEVDEENLEVGDVVYTEDGTEHVMLDPETAAELGYADEDLADYDGGTTYEVDEPQFAGVGKAVNFNLSDDAKSLGGAKKLGQSLLGNKNTRRVAGGAGAGAAFAAGRGSKSDDMSKSLGQSVLEELSKSLDQSDRDEVISKLGDMVQESRNEASEAWSIAKALLDERDTLAYTQLAEQYDLPVDPQELGSVLKRAAEVLPERDVQLLDRVFTAAGSGMYQELGYNGYAESDVMSNVAAMASNAVAKHDLTNEQAIVGLFEANPAAYDEYLSESR